VKRNYVITSESVTQGHPDKLCDQISDAIVDHFLMQDPYARVRAECAVSSAIVFIAARFHTKAKVDLPHVARKVIKRVGYDQPDFNSKTCSILTAPQGLPPDKKACFNEHDLTNEEIEKIGVKNQVTVFGFACDQTPSFMPYPIWLARRLTRYLTTVQQEKQIPYLMPDGGVQVGVEFADRRPSRIHSVTIVASQRSFEEADPKTLERDIMEAVVQPVFKGHELVPDKHTRIWVNPDGPTIGGPSHHSGLTGRKNAVDNYGIYARHSAHALSGKDPLRIDRAGTYAARHAAKNVVAAGFAAECEVTLSYSIGLSRPVSILVNTFGTGKQPDMELNELVEKVFDFRIAAILRQLNLRHLPGANPRGFYQDLAANGHFGRADLDLPWERTDMGERLLG
jgi:S-adenosylmethionine synthetase